MQKLYPPISAYGFISDCHSSALVSQEGSIDWCCMPRIDSSSCFGRLLSWHTGGFCSVAPVGLFHTSRRYLPETMILETTFTCDSGSMRLVDLFPLCRGGKRQPHRQLLRIVEGLAGQVPLALDIVPRFEYGAIKPWIKSYRNQAFAVIGGCDGLLISGDFALNQTDRHSLAAAAAISAGERMRLSILYRSPHMLDNVEIDVPEGEVLDLRLEETILMWHAWSERATVSGPTAELVRRSALVLKALTHAPTGAIAAAATSSLPEAPGGTRNWDYRFTWVRDSVFTTRSLAEIGFYAEADGFRRFIERSAAGCAEELQIMFGVGGERRLEEYVIDSLEGYRGAAPVRVGNAAYRQPQHDIYGELMELAWSWHQRGHAPDDDYWSFLVELVGEVSRVWRKRDHGIWEVRGRRRDFVFSKVMCWSAVDKGIAMAEDLGRSAPLEEWRTLRHKIRIAIERKGYDHDRGVFVQFFGGRAMDAALLLMPMTGFIAFDDPRMMRTVDAIRDELCQNGFVQRYGPAAADDGLPEPEGVFLACSFWLAECLFRQGRMKEAHEVFDLALSTGNELGLFSEQFIPLRAEMSGNFPQGLTHLSLISAAMALDRISIPRE